MAFDSEISGLADRVCVLRKTVDADAMPIGPIIAYLSESAAD